MQCFRIFLCCSHIVKRFHITTPLHKRSLLNNYINNYVIYTPKRFYNSSFINQVLSQVRKEMETNTALKQSMKEFKESGVTEVSGSLKNWLKKNLTHLKTCRYYTFQQNPLYQFFQQNKILNAFLLRHTQHINQAYSYLKKINISLFDSVTFVLKQMKDDEALQVQQKINLWKQQQQQQEFTTTAEKTNFEENTTAKEENAQTDKNALVLTEQSAWERFGTKLQDMPFLSNFFENGVINKLFGETVQAAALREMKTLDPSFKLPELVDLVEHIIARHLLHCFLAGDQDVLRLHCGKAAFAAIHQSIKERQASKIVMDSNILFLRNVEFRGAVSIPDSPPWFIFTFCAQHVNCMRELTTKKVVIGAIDDIREIVYSIALRKHPNENLPSLEYPWQIMEFGIIENNPCW